MNKYAVRKSIFLFLAVFVILSLHLLISCDTDNQKEGKIGIVVTILPQMEFVERIGGDKVDVTVMIPPGASPHTYEPTPSQMINVSEATIYFKVGSGIDFEIVWLDKLIANNPEIIVVDCSEGITLQKIEITHEHEDEKGEHHESEFDPHIWTSPRNAAVMVNNITDGLIDIDPKNQVYYENNRNTYLQEINLLDNDVRNGLADIKNRIFMVYHPAFGYFADEYELTQLSIEAEGKEPTAAGIQHLIEQARQYNIRVVFAEPQFNPQSAEVIANEIDGDVILIDPLAKDYLVNMGTMVEKLIQSME
jgi:zinc transport system substrate-binding protein